MAVEDGDEGGGGRQAGEQRLDVGRAHRRLSARPRGAGGEPAGVEAVGRGDGEQADPRHLFGERLVRGARLGHDGAGKGQRQRRTFSGLDEPVAAGQDVAAQRRVHGARRLIDGARGQPAIDGAALRLLEMAEAPEQDFGELVGEGGLERRQPRLAHREQRRAHRLVRAAFRRQGDAGRRARQQEAGVLVAGVVQRIEAARDEGVVDRAHREQAGAEELVRKPEGGQQEEEVVLGDPELDVLAVPAQRPFLHRDDLLRAEDVLPVGPVENAALVHPPPQIRRDGDVRRGGDDAGGERALALAEVVQDAAEGLLRGDARAGAERQRVGQRDGRGLRARRLAVEGRGGDEIRERPLVHGEPGEGRPFGAFRDAHGGAEIRHLLLGHDAGVVVLVAGEGQTEALDRVHDEAMGDVGPGRVQGFQDRLHVVAREIGHQVLEAVVVVAGEQRLHSRHMADVAREAGPPGGASLEGERAVELVRAVVDPLPQRSAAELREGGLLAVAVFQDHHLPAHRLEEILDLLEQAVRDHAVQALAVVVDDPPEVAHVVLPAFEQRLEDVALVELRVAHDGDHAAGRARLGRELVEAHVVLHHRGEQRHADAEADRAGGDVHVVAVLGPRRIALRTAQRAEVLQLGPGLLAEEVLDRVEHRAGVGFHRDAVVRPEDVEIERRHQGRDRRAGSLVAAHLEAVAGRAQMVRVVDRPGGEPQHLPLQRVQAGEGLRRDDGSVRESGHAASPAPRARPGRGWAGPAVRASLALHR